MQLDSDIKQDVEDELRSDPDIDATDIAIVVKDGTVTLTGFVRSFRQRRRAEQDVKRVAGVVGIVNDIEVRLPIIHRRPDPEIARDAVEAIKRELPLSWEKIKAIVEDGWITLEGDVEWHYQRERAEEAVQGLRGVRGDSAHDRTAPRKMISLPFASTESPVLQTVRCVTAGSGELVEAGAQYPAMVAATLHKLLPNPGNCLLIETNV